MSIENLINNVKSGDVQSSNNSFNSIMADKINSALDTERKQVASKMYGVEEDPEMETETEIETKAETEVETEGETV